MNAMPLVAIFIRKQLARGVARCRSVIAYSRPVVTAYSSLPAAGQFPAEGPALSLNPG